MVLKESQLKELIKECVKQTLLKINESYDKTPIQGSDDGYERDYSQDDDPWTHPLQGKVHPSPYQDIIDKLTPIYRELNGKFGGINGIGNGVELSQTEANQLDAANHILKAMDLLRYPKMKRDN